MRYTRLGRTDLSVSVIGLGCGNFGGIGSAQHLFGQGDDEAAAFALLDAARERGVTLLDTADAYGGGRSESYLGRWLASRGARDEVVLTTKVCAPTGPDDPGGLAPDRVRRQIDSSLRRLGTDRVDLYLAHGPDPSVPVEVTVAGFEELVQAGKIRYAGFSNVTDLTHLPPTTVQNCHNLLEPLDEAFLEGCAAAGIGVTAYSPLGGGWLAGRYRAGEPFPPRGSRMALRPYTFGDRSTAESLAVVGRLTDAATARGTTLPALALAWVIADPRVATALVAPHTAEQLDAAIAALDVRLTVADRAELRSSV